MHTDDPGQGNDSRLTGSRPILPDAETARRMLEDGNRVFSRLLEGCRSGDCAADERRIVVRCSDCLLGRTSNTRDLPAHSPFAVVVGCSDARVPVELIFGQGFNDLFVVRVAGNVIGDVCQGSIDYAANALAESVRLVVLLGHSGCGAVTAAVDSYLQPQTYWAGGSTPMIRAIVQRIMVAVREAANGLKTVWGVTARDQDGYRDALIESAIAVNSAMAAFDVRQTLEAEQRHRIQVLYGVFNLRNHQVCMPVVPHSPPRDENVRLVEAPSDPRHFGALAIQMAEILHHAYVPVAPDHPGPSGSDGSTATGDNTHGDSSVLGNALEPI